MIFGLPIGDLSLDGHEKTETCVCTTAVNLATIRKAYMDIHEKTGIQLSQLCHDDSTIPAEIVAKIEKTGYNFKTNWARRDRDGNVVNVQPDDLFDILIHLLNHVDRRANVRRMPVQSIDFSGKDASGRYFEAAGYGLFTE